MSDRPRLYRPDPIRTEPLRDWSKLYRDSDSWPRRDTRESSGHGGEVGADSKAAKGAASYGVELGYRLMKEYIRIGQESAKRFNSGMRGGPADADNLQKLIERIFGYYADLVPLWRELFNLMATSSLDGFASFLRRPDANHGNGTPAARQDSEAQGAPIAIEISSARPARVTIDLRPGSEQIPLTIHGLRAIAPETPPLTDITFVSATETEGAFVKVCIPHEHPPGLYSGAVLNATTGEPLGTMSVRISG